MEWVASTLHTTSEHGVSSITTVDGAHLGSQQSTELTPTGRFKWTRPLRPERRNLVSARVPSHFNWPLLVSVSCWGDSRSVLLLLSNKCLV